MYFKIRYETLTKDFYEGLNNKCPTNQLMTKQEFLSNPRYPKIIKNSKKLLSMSDNLFIIDYADTSTFNLNCLNGIIKSHRKSMSSSMIFSELIDKREERCYDDYENVCYVIGSDYIYFNVFWRDIPEYRREYKVLILDTDENNNPIFPKLYDSRYPKFTEYILNLGNDLMSSPKTRELELDQLECGHELAVTI